MMHLGIMIYTHWTTLKAYFIRFNGQWWRTCVDEEYEM